MMGEVKTEKRTVYITGDGKEFLDFVEAQVYETRRVIRELLDKHSVGHGSEWYTADFLDFMIENRDEILHALDPFYGEE